MTGDFIIRGSVALPARIVVAGTHSGAGKTSVATGLAAALVAAGHRVATAKVGPDFIDPGYHAVATGRPGRNLDAWMSGAAAVPALAERAAGDADVLVVEGVMGLFDGAASAVPGAIDPVRDDASTAHVARALAAPVVLVVDAASMSRSVAAIVAGFVGFDPEVRVAGVILNRVGSDGHERLLRDAIEPLGVPVLGVLRRDDAFAWRDRHLGLVPVVEQRAEVAESVARLAAAVAAGCDLEAVVRLARTAPATVAGSPLRPTERVVEGGGPPLRIAVAGGSAFSFSYPDNLERLSETGAEVVPFDPLTDPALPDDVAGLVVGGGFPEVFGAALADNAPLLADVAARVRVGLPTWAECGGLLWLARSLDGHEMAGVIDADGVMTDRLSLGYRTATALVDTPIGPAGTELRGHEFHYSQLTPAGAALHLEGRFGRGEAGHASPTVLASYLHVHLGADPAPAEHFVRTCVAARS
ncbi:cobyrinate a,c-diamide synthase [soil metagenome]